MTFRLTTAADERGVIHVVSAKKFFPDSPTRYAVCETRLEKSHRVEEAPNCIGCVGYQDD